MPGETYKDIPVLHFSTLQEWLAWLEANGDSTPTGAWMKLAKKGSGQPGLNYDQTREGALRHGWVDSTPNKLDDQFYLLKVTPRRPKSIWSKINRELCEKWEADGLMTAAGQREVEAAKADGRWANAYAGQSTAQPTDEFLRVLDAHPPARELFDSLSKSDRYPFIFRLQQLKRADTRERRMAEYAQLLQKGEKLS